MVYINTISIVAILITLCATICCGKSLYDDIDTPEINDISGITEVKRPSFYAGSRYGRSQYSGPSNNLRIAPRRDFHFLRYGKRANADDSQPTIQCFENVRDYVLTCSFTGVRDYYRCWKGQENKFNAIEQITTNTGEKEGQHLIDTNIPA